MDLNIVLKDLQNYKRSKDTLLPMYIQLRLDKSLVTYYKQLSSSIKYYDKKDELRILKNLGGPK